MKFLKLLFLMLFLGLLSGCSSNTFNDPVVDSKKIAPVEASDAVIESFEATVIEANWHGGGYHGGYSNLFESDHIELIYFDSNNIKSSVVVGKYDLHIDGTFDYPVLMTLERHSNDNEFWWVAIKK